MHTKVSIMSLIIFASFSQCKVTVNELALSYDDVLLLPKYSSVSSRSTVSTQTYLTPKITLQIPVVGANMDTVTESAMAIALAQQGGIGIIHRYNTIAQQVREIEMVKRARNAIIERPFTIGQDATIEQARQVMEDNNITSLLVTNDHQQLIGIITSRDMRFIQDEKKMVADFMTKKDRLIVASQGLTIEQANKILDEHRIEKLPLVNNDGTIAGLITSKDIIKKNEFPLASVDSKDRYLVGAAIGVKDDALERAEALIAAGADVLVVDIAHGHCNAAIEIIKKIKERFPSIDIIAGNVATAQGTKDLIEAGADAIKVGVGPGSICTTRITTGAGCPQLSAVINCSAVAREYGIPVIADGGIRYSGDITKAIAAGASTVMLGSLLAGTEESPGVPFIKNGRKYKVIRGMASFGAQLGRDAKTNSKNKSQAVPEGVEAVVPYRGSVTEIVQQLIGGLRSGLSYCGCSCMLELIGNGEFVQITSAGVKESHPHDVIEAV